jgi:hypothetical protein
MLQTRRGCGHQRFDSRAAGSRAMRRRSRCSTLVPRAGSGRQRLVFAVTQGEHPGPGPFLAPRATQLAQNRSQQRGWGPADAGRRRCHGHTGAATTGGLGPGSAVAGGVGAEGRVPSLT